MKAVNFYKLPRAIQDRFVGSVMSGFPPAPILATRESTPTKFAWLVLSLVCFVGLLVLTRLGYGALDSGLALHSRAALAFYASLVFGFAFGLVQAFASVVRERALPYRAGVYLFPACLIDARSDQFKVLSTQDLTGIDAQGSAVRVSFSGGAEYTFVCSDPARASVMVNEVQAARERALHAKATEEPKELVAVDPLHVPRFSSPVGPRDPYELRRPPWGKLGWLAALAVAATVAPTLWAFRNAGSDKTMYARATQANDAASYRAYLARGKKYGDEVANVLLPRAELRDAEHAGTVEALLAYKSAHPETKIGGEISASIRAAMLAELEKAKAAGSLAALEDFAKRYPEHGIEPELREAMHAVYTRELDAYKKHAAAKDRSIVPFVERLFAWTEKRGSRVEVRFRRKKSESMTRADQFVAKTPSFMGEVSYPSRQFDDKRSARREAVLGKMLATRLDAGFSPELFDVLMGAPVAFDAEVLPDVTVPTLFVSYTVDWSGNSYQSTKPRGAYIGVIFAFESLFVIPNDPKSVKLKADIMKLPPLQILKDEDLNPGPAEEKVYETMATDAFESFGNRLLGLFFVKEKEKEKEK